jgi:hypothetical protein
MAISRARPTATIASKWACEKGASPDKIDRGPMIGWNLNMQPLIEVISEAQR